MADNFGGYISLGWLSQVHSLVGLECFILASRFSAEKSAVILMSFCIRGFCFVLFFSSSNYQHTLCFFIFSVLTMICCLYWVF